MESREPPDPVSGKIRGSLALEINATIRWEALRKPYAMTIKKWILRLFFFLSALEAGWALASYLGHETGLEDLTAVYQADYPTLAGWFTGLLTAAAVLLVLVGLGAVGLLAASWLRPAWFERLTARGAALAESPAGFYRALFLLLGGGLLAAHLLLQEREGLIEFQLALLKQLEPLLVFLMLVFLQGAAALLAIRPQRGKRPARWRWVGLFLGGLLLTAGAITWCGCGYRRSSAEAGYFRLTGYPLLGYQAAAALLVVILFSWLLFRQRKRGKAVGTPRGWRMDLGLSLLVLAASQLAWQGLPVEPNAFIDIPRPPNQEVVPALDGIFYDRAAQHLLSVGELQSYPDGSRLEPVARRPLLTLFYGGLHGLFGPGYQDILPAQIAVFGLFPVLVYLFSKELVNRPTGLLVSGLMILRQRNGILLGGEVTGGNLQMILSDFPAAIGFLLALFLALLWLKNQPDRPLLPLLAGGGIGAAMLIRQEVMVLIPAVLLTGLVMRWKHPGWWLRGAAWLGLGVLLVTGPWMIRNYQKTGQVYLEAPWNFGLVRQTLRRLDRGGGQSRGTPLPGSSGQGLSPALGAGTSGPGGLLAPRFQERGEGLEVLGDHLSSSLTQSVLYLPSRPLMLDINYLTRAPLGDLERTYGGVWYGLEEYVRLTPYWRPDWEGRAPRSSWTPIGVLLLLIAGGLTAAREKRGRLLLLPSLAFLGHISAYTLVRYSGGRFLLPVDWIPALFYSAGLIQLAGLLLGEKLGNWLADENAEAKGEERTSRPRCQPVVLALAAAGCLLLGLSPLAAERWMPDRYPPRVLENRVKTLLEHPASPLSAVEQQALEALLASGGAAEVGRALYPRHFEPGEEVIPTVEVYWENHTAFYLSGTKLVYVVLPMEAAPEEFPHFSEVVVFGRWMDPERFSPGNQICLHCFGRGIAAEAVVIYDDAGEVLDVLWAEGGVQ